MSDFFEDSSEDEGDEIIRDKTVNGSNNGIASYSVSDNNKQKQGSSGLKISIQTAPNISAKNSGAYEDDSSDEDLLDGDFDDDESDEDEEDGEGRNSKKKVATGVGIEFCEECQTMMRPREDKQNKKIYYKCYHCSYEDRSAQRMVVARNELRKDRQTQLHIYRNELTHDKSLSRRMDLECPSCGNKEAVMFLGGSQKAKDDQVDLVFMCCKCKFKWVHEKKKEDAMEE